MTNQAIILFFLDGGYFWSYIIFKIKSGRHIIADISIIVFAGNVSVILSTSKMVIKLNNTAITANVI